MSYTEIFGFDKNGNACHYADINNAFRSGMSIWSILEQKYLTTYIPEYARKNGITMSEDCEKRLGYRPTRCTSIMDNNAMKEIWNLADGDDVSMTDKVCLFTTFDNCLIKSSDIPKVIEAFRAFEGETSLNEQADVLEQMYLDEDYIAAGWNQTSVNGDTWGKLWWV